MSPDDEKCRWHDERLSLIEGALWGSPPERVGGMCKQVKEIQATLAEVRIWIRAIAAVATIYVLVFGPDQIKGLIRLWR